MARANAVLTGTAMDAKSGAVLVTADETIVYIERLDYWPPDFIGKKVSVSGILKQKKIIPDPKVDSNGAVSQGGTGEQKVLEQATWKLVD